MPWAVAAAGISAAGAIGGGLIQGGAAASAGNAQQAAEQQALAYEQGIYRDAQGNLQPFINTGQTALGNEAGLLGLPGPNGQAGNALAAYNQFTQTPFYQVPYQLGVGAMNASGAARGLTLSGGQMNSLQQFGQGYASQGLSNYMSALNTLAGNGQNAAGSLGNIGMGISGQNLQANTLSGQAGSAGIMGGANATTGVINNLSGILGNGQPGNSGLLSNPQFQQWLGGNSSYNLTPAQGNSLASMGSFNNGSGVTINGN